MYCTLLYYSLLFSTQLFSSRLVSSLLCSALLYCTLLYSTLLYSALLSLLFCTPLYSTVLYSAALLCYSLPSLPFSSPLLSTPYLQSANTNCHTSMNGISHQHSRMPGPADVTFGQGPGQSPKDIGSTSFSSSGDLPKDINIVINL